MKLCQNQYYHFYSRTNNEELLFRSNENYIYFLKKYRFYLDNFFDTIGYCLMPTHFHFLVRIKEKTPTHLMTSQSSDEFLISNNIAILLRSYTRAFNKMYDRHGSLFQARYKVKLIDNDKYLITLLTYIHQNPIRSGLTTKAEEWLFSSYQNYIDLRKGSLPQKELILSMISKKDLFELTNNKINNIDTKFWI